MDAFSQESEVFRMLFEQHFDLADRFTEAAGRVEKVDTVLRGTDGANGLIEILEAAGNHVEQAAMRLDAFEVAGLDQKIQQTNQQIQALPQRLLKVADDLEFRHALAKALAEQLDGAIQQAQKAGVSLVTDLLAPAAEKIVEAASREAFGNAAMNAKALDKARGQIDGLIAERDSLNDSLKNTKVAMEEIARVEREALARQVERAQSASGRNLKATMVSGLVFGMLLSPHVSDLYHFIKLTLTTV